MNGLDYVVLAVTVAAVLLIGWLSGKKDKSAAEFLMAGKGINKLQAGFSMAATDFGGSGLVGAIGYCYVVGMSGIWWNLAAAPAFFLVGLFLAEKIHKMNSTTVPEYLGKRYSPAVKCFAIVMHVFTNFASLSVQFTIACTTLYTITGISMHLSLFISVLLVIILTSGGLRSVVNTDATLFVIIIASVLCLLVAMLYSGAGIEVIKAGLPAETFSLSRLGFWKPFSWFVLCMLSYSTNQNYIQRMTAAKNEGTARFGAFFTAGFYFAISVMIGLIGICASVKIPGITDTNTVFAQALKSFLPHGIIGLGMAGLFAATISTGTSILHATTTLIINDLWKPLRKVEENSAAVSTSKIILLLIALSSTLISLFCSNIIDVIYIAGLFYSVSVFLPLILGMLNSKITAAGALLSMIAAVSVSLLWEYNLIERTAALNALPANVVGLVISAAVLMLSLFIRKKE
ncbi:sodium:solute symporter family protein [Ihubacter sp. rT4E-8]|uniref:sodium:solute symporter family protein n=1 Tax=Ihubacter sp. rT4E-8 TaxID=3242369 RepID=UPI003CE91691